MDNEQLVAGILKVFGIPNLHPEVRKQLIDYLRSLRSHVIEN